MAVPSYTEDLTDIDLAESGSTGWTAFNISGGGGGAPAFGADFGMQGAGCWDKAASNAERGLAVNKTPGTGTVAAGVHIFQWGFTATPGVCDTLQNRGAYVIIGTSTTDYVQFHVEGSDTFGAQGRVGKCYVVDYVTTANTGSVPYRTVGGTPGATPTYFGFGLKTLATVKGSNMGADAVRYGTGAYLTAGELISAGDASDNPCTFSGFQAQNDNINNRWGILTSTGGDNYEQQGRFVIGQNNAGTATLCRFKDNDKNISIVDTVHSTIDFTQFIVDHASTRCEWTNINLTGLGTNNPGQVQVTTNNPTVIIEGGTWTSIGVTVFRSNTSVDGLTWRLTDSITLNGATLDNCLIDRCTASSAVVTDDLADLNNNNFIGDGTGHAVELTSVGSGTMAWDNTFDTTTYATSDGSTGNEAIYVNVGSGSLTINVSAGATTPTIRTAGAAVTVVAGAVTAELTVNDHTGTAYFGARAILKAANGTGDLPYQDSVTITRSGSTASVSHTSHGMSSGKKVEIKGADQSEYNGVKTISNVTTNAYDFTVSGTPTTPATGTIVATGVVFEGLTDSSGYISDSRTYSVAQPYVGVIRKGTSSPYYKDFPLSGTISNATGASLTAQLILDE
jgi:hypothetical protein